MKKLLLLTAFGFLASPAFAQNTAATNQSGPGNDADITQTGSNTANVTQTSTATGNGAELHQNGSSNTADVTQTGDDNEVFSQQLRGSVGSSTPSNFSQFTAEQDGTGNYAGNRQAGDRNITEITQVGTNNGARQGDTIGLNSQGNDNETYVNQIGDDNDVWVRFTGSFNDASVDQGTTGDESTGAFARVTFKGGNENFADIDQYGAGIVGNQADVSAVGSLNRVTVRQEGDDNVVDRSFSGPLTGVAIDGDANIVDILQQGNGNTASAFITGGAVGVGNMVDIDQTSDGNVATVDIMGDSNSSTITQN